MENFIQLMLEILKSSCFVRCIWSNARSKSFYTKVVATPVLIKKELFLQLSQYKDNKVYHENITLQKCESTFSELCASYKQIQLVTSTHHYHGLVNKKGELHLKKTVSTEKNLIQLDHNRKKNYLLDPNSDFLVALGLTDKQGQIKPSKYDKFKQINRYLEFVDGCMNYLNQSFIRIIDFGCGKSYLTFALYYYLTFVLNKEVEIIGLD